ncbi:MAG: alpha/beta hydrolase family protein [Pseudomarimonas sp.]
MRLLRSLSLFFVGSSALAADVDLDVFLKRGTFGEMRLSPDGKHLAATVDLEDRTVLVILRREGMQPTAKAGGEAHSAIAEFHWVDNQNVVLSMANRFGDLDTPLATGELHLVNTDGSRARTLFSPYNDGQDPNINSRAVAEARKFASLIDTLPGDPKRILVGVEEWNDEYPLTNVDLLHLETGRRKHLTRPPVRSATIRTDPSGQPRLAYGIQDGHHSVLFHREADADRWELLNDEAKSGRVEVPLGFSADGKLAYLRVSDEKGPDRVIAWDPATQTRTDVASDPRVDPAQILREGSGAVIGMAFLGAKRRTQYFDDQHPDARIQKMLDSSFAASDVYLHPAPANTSLRLFEVRSDRDPGSFFLFDVASGHAAFLSRRLPAVDTQKMAITEVVDIPARDGLLLQGFVTRPLHADPKLPLPLIVLPHGGPFGVFDQRDFDAEVQMFAAAGYAVLQVNFRGSGNYGRAFESAGAREWGKAMQDDVVDATRWAIARNISSEGRVCIVGASYGAYAALMGVAREPDLYACAVGYVGIYDLAQLVQDHRGENPISASWSRDWVGEAGELQAASPTNLAAQIKAPVLLAAGGEDRVAPIRHSERMQKALERSGAEVETYYVKTAGHGFYLLEHRREYYTRVLAFLGRHLDATTRSPD